MTLDDWTAAVTLALGLDYDDPRTRDEVLLLAREAAHGVARPAAPLTTFLLGVAVGRGADLVDAAHQVRRLLPDDEPSADEPSAHEARADAPGTDGAATSGDGDEAVPLQE